MSLTENLEKLWHTTSRRTKAALLDAAFAAVVLLYLFIFIGICLFVWTFLYWIALVIAVSAMYSGFQSWFGWR